MIIITMLMLKIITMINSKIKITAIRISRSVVVMIIIMLIMKYMSFILLKLIFRNRNDELWIASSFNISLRIKMFLLNIVFWIFQLTTFARSKTLINRKFLSTLKRYVLSRIWEIEKKEIIFNDVFYISRLFINFIFQK